MIVLILAYNSPGYSVEYQSNHHAAGSEDAMLYLRIVRGPGRQEYLAIAEKDLPFTIGRGRENKLHIKSSAVSRFHAVLFAENGEHLVQDMESTNGTFLNGKMVTKSKLRSGDKVAIGDINIIVEGPRSPLEENKAPLDLTVSINKTLTDEASISIKNPTEQLFIDKPPGAAAPKLSRSYKALQLLYRADKVLRDIDDFKQLLENFMDLIMEVIPASRGYIFLVDKDSGALVPFVRRAPDEVSTDTEIVVSRTILLTAVEQKESIISNDALVDERFVHSRSVAQLEVRSAMCAPLVNRGKVLGIIYLDSTDKSNLYKKDDRVYRNEYLHHHIVHRLNFLHREDLRNLRKKSHGNLHKCR